MKKRILSMALAAALTFGASQQAMAQTPVQQGVRAGSNTTTVNGTSVTAGQVVSAGRGTTVTVTTTDRTGESTPKVAKVTVTKITDIKATGITVTSAGNVGEMNGNATLQMTANFDPTYTDDKTVVWSVAPAPESSATATIDGNGLLTAGTVQGDVVVTATATNGTATTDDDKTDSKTITITTIPLTPDMITVAAATYTGSALTPGVTVKYGTTDLVEDQDYTLGSWSNNVNAGTNTASVTITGTGAYSGSIVKYFTIARASWTGSISLSYTTSGNKIVHVQYNGEGSAYITKWERCSSTNVNWNGSNPNWAVPDNSEKNTSFDDYFTVAVQKVQYRVTIGPDTQNHKQTVITSEMYSTP